MSLDVGPRQRRVVLAEAVGSPTQRAMALAVLAVILADVAPPGEALPVALEASVVAYEVDSHVDQVDSLTALALCCARAGRHAVAARVYEVVLRRMDRRGTPPWHFVTADKLAACFVAAGLPPPTTATHDLPVAAVLAEAAAVAGDLPRP